MGDITQDQIAERHAIDSLTSQVSALGYTTMQCLQGMPRACVGEVGLKRVEALGLAFQVYCRGICDQMAAESEHVDGGLSSAIFQLGAIGNYAIEHLALAQIRLQGGEDRQRLFVTQAALAIQDACDSIAMQIGRELA
jgi:hypothetical protein